jgi:hypothetical protein
MKMAGKKSNHLIKCGKDILMGNYDTVEHTVILKTHGDWLIILKIIVDGNG